MLDAERESAEEGDDEFRMYSAVYESIERFGFCPCHPNPFFRSGGTGTGLYEKNGTLTCQLYIAGHCVGSVLIQGPDSSTIAPISSHTGFTYRFT